MGGLEVRRLLKKISGEWGYFKANRQVAITCRLFSNMWPIQVCLCEATRCALNRMSHP